MRKFLPIIIGVLIGSALSMSFIINEKDYSADAKSALEAWDLNEWNNVFGLASKGQEVYQLVYNKLIRFPEEDALKDVAQKYGLTIDEAQAVVNGSIAPIFNNPDRRSTTLTQEQAFQLMENLQNDYDLLEELYDLQQELDVAINPSEIFSNGDLSDSGFDLVYDLTFIEELLFMAESPVNLGGDFLGQINTPYLPTDEDFQAEEYVDRDSFDQMVGILVADEGDEEILGDDGTGRGGDGRNSGQNGLLELNNDVCVDGSVEPNVAGRGGSGEDSGEGEGGGSGGEGSGEEEGNSDSGNGGVGREEEDIWQPEDDEGNIQPAPIDQWRKSWCPALEDPQHEASTEEVMAVAGFNNPTDIGGSASVAAGAGVETVGFSANVAICITTDVVYKTVTSYLPGDTCVLCEVEKINDEMSKTLSHSLVPNKATGNLMESAKCKDALEVPLIDMKFIAIAAPVSTPLNDDVIFGKNIVEEWNKFVERYRPVLYPKTEVYSSFELATAEDGTSQTEIIESVRDTVEKETAEAVLTYEGYQIGDEASNMSAYLQAVLTEMRQMTAFFEAYETIFTKIEFESCQQGILLKEDR